MRRIAKNCHGRIQIFGPNFSRPHDKDDFLRHSGQAAHQAVRGDRTAIHHNQIKSLSRRRQFFEELGAIDPRPDPLGASRQKHGQVRRGIQQDRRGEQLYASQNVAQADLAFLDLNFPRLRGEPAERSSGPEDPRR